MVIFQRMLTIMESPMAMSAFQQLQDQGGQEQREYVVTLP